MTALEPALRELRESCRRIAHDLRSRALAVDADPDAMDAHLSAPTLALLRAASTPKQYRCDDVPHEFEAYTESCLARAVAVTELSYGDPGLLCANTGPSLAGVAVDALGSDEQREQFHRILADGRTWSFFGMTEESVGSDATAMRARLDPGPDGGRLLRGAKRYISNGSRGAVGVVFARTGESPLSIRAVLLRCPAPGFTATPLDTTGLRGARISELSFDGLHVPRELVLGAHLPVARRGLWGAGRTFNLMRVQIAAMALGTGLAALGYVREQRPHWSGDEVVEARLEAARELLYDVAAAVDLAPDDRRSPSVAKLHITDLAIQVTRWAAAVLGPGSLLEHPLLEKWSRDVCAFEFMDGTSNILRLNIAPGVAPVGEEP